MRRAITLMTIGWIVGLTAVCRAQTTQPADNAPTREQLLKIRELLLNGKTQEALKATNAALGQTESATAPVATAPTSPGPAQPASPQSPPAQNVEQYNVHGQITTVTQKHGAFPAPYTGPHSLIRRESAKTSLTATLFMGLRLPWDGGAVYFDPDLAGGEGLSGVQGIASFPNDEISRVVSTTPQPYVSHAYIQQIIGLGGEQEHVDSDQNQLAGFRDVHRLTLTFGKMSATDLFDNNTYSHDPRTQFLNESLVDDTAWDYPADARGYSVGGVAEYNEANWTLRYGAFQEPTTANGGSLDGHVPKSLGQVIEYEDRWTVGGQPGAARLLAYVNTAHMGNYRQAIDHPGPNGPDVTLTRTYSAKYGFSLSTEQALTPDLGIFSRLGWNDGHTETWAFTEVDRLGSLGISLKGAAWNRPDDVFGFAGSIAGIAKDHRDYLRDGGLGFIIGDGKLSYAPEQVLETYYLIKVTDNLFVTPDLQFVDHPAYNSDRGPVFIGAVRAHAEF